MAEDWTNFVDYLAHTLPAQSTYFMQILVVTTTSYAAFELLRPIPLVLAALRTRIGPNLTEKERNKTFLGMRPLNNPPEFPHVSITARLVRESVNVKMF